MKFAKISCIRCRFMIYLYLRRRGETGRRAGLKILWTNHPCRFESDRRHQRKNNLAKTVRLFFHISAPSRLRVRARIYEKIKCIALARLLLSARRRYKIPPNSLIFKQNGCLRVRARIYEKIKCVALARLLLSARRRYSIPPNS